MTIERKRKGPHKMYQLTASGVANLLKTIPVRLAAGENVRQTICDGGCLYLTIAQNGSASWTIRYMINGRSREMGLGSVQIFTLAEARLRAHKYRQLIVDGIDPLEQRPAPNKSVAQQAIQVASSQGQGAAPKSQIRQTFFDVLDDFIKIKLPEHADPTWESTWRNSLDEYVKPFFKTTPVNLLTYDMALGVFERKVTVDKTTTSFWLGKTVTAVRVRQRILQIMERAAAIPGYDGESPAIWSARLDNDLPSAELIQDKENHPSLPYALVPDFVGALRKRGTVVAQYLEFLILTIGPRSGPTLKATWDQMDKENKIWTVPRGSMKAKKNGIHENFVVPLSARCIEILEAMEKIKQDDYVFPSSKKKAPMSSNTVKDMIDAMCDEDEKTGIAPRWIDPHIDNRRIVPHGFRASFMSYCMDKNLGTEELRDFALGHKIKGAVKQGYNRGQMLDLRRDMMDKWTEWVQQV